MGDILHEWNAERAKLETRIRDLENVYSDMRAQRDHHYVELGKARSREAAWREYVDLLTKDLKRYTWIRGALRPEALTPEAEVQRGIALRAQLGIPEPTDPPPPKTVDPRADDNPQ